MDRPTLPLEIVSEIIYNVPDSDHATLYACCLTSKFFLPLARAKLYADLTFTICKARQRGFDSQGNRTLSQFLSLESALLRDKLLDKPELGVHVKAAYIASKGSAELSSQIGALLLDELRGCCPHLHQLRIQPAAYWERSDETDAAVARFGSQLRALSYSGVRSWTAEWLEMLCQLDALEHLDDIARAVFRSNHPGNEAEPPSFELKSFSGPSDVKRWFLFFILHNLHTSLTSLSLFNKAIGGHVWDLSPFVALESLDLRMAPGQIVELGTHDNKGILFTIGTCPDLVSLTLRTSQDAFKVWRLAAEKPFLHLLPSSLRALNVGDVHVSDHYIIDALADPTILPALRSLVVADSTQFDDCQVSYEKIYQPYLGIEEIEEARHWTSARREDSVRGEIEQACEAQSIVLTWRQWKQGER